MLVSINVPLEPPDQQYWQAAVGYVELGMFQDANDQLEKIDPFNRAAPEVLAIRLAIYRGLEKWELMQEIAKRLKEFEPDNVQWTISLAYATRRAYSTEVAMKILLSAEPKFPKEAAIPYNLAWRASRSRCLPHRKRESQRDVIGCSVPRSRLHSRRHWHRHTTAD